MGNRRKLWGVTVLGDRAGLYREPATRQLWPGVLWAGRPESRRQSSIQSPQPHITLFDARYAQLFKVSFALSAGHFAATALAIPLAHDSKKAPSGIGRGL
jgi:hypothetical protein